MNTAVIKSLIVIASYVAAVFIAVYFGALYSYVFPYAAGGSFIGDPDTLNWIVGFPLAVIFLLTLLMHVSGGKYVWWWNIIALAPTILFEAVLDPLHVYFPIILGFIAWGLGYAANKLLWTVAPRMMAKIS